MTDDTEYQTILAAVKTYIADSKALAANLAKHNPSGEVYARLGEDLQMTPDALVAYLRNTRGR